MNTNSTMRVPSGGPTGGPRIIRQRTPNALLDWLGALAFILYLIMLSIAAEAV